MLEELNRASIEVGLTMNTDKIKLMKKVTDKTKTGGEQLVLQ